ncbi:MAG: CPBP family intramembrane metalloprotease [Clostridia bacterium]|nr:CPBP family intramembrane metalloprotease [Clostridia bacterium]
MNKKDIFKRPECILDAQRTKPHNLIVEILIFIAVFIVTEIVVALASIIPSIIFMFTSSDFMAVAQTGDAGQIAAYLTEDSDFMTVLSLFFTAFEILVPVIYCRTIEKRGITTMGFVKKNWLGEYAVGLLVGLVIFSAAVGIGVLTGALEVSLPAKGIDYLWIAIVFLGFLVQGMAEEVMCRGYFMVSISRKYSLPVAIIVSALVFAALHLGNDGMAPLAFVNIFLFGVFAAIYFIKRGSIWGIAAIHSIWNFAQGNIYGIKVSGMDTGDSFLSTVFNESGELFNGGAFGLEGGLCVTIVLVVGIIAVSFLKGKNVPAAVEIKES